MAIFNSYFDITSGYLWDRNVNAQSLCVLLSQMACQWMLQHLEGAKLGPGKRERLRGVGSL